jgi:hypothetical protein
MGVAAVAFSITARARLICEDLGTFRPLDVGLWVGVALGKIGLDVTHQLVDQSPPPLDRMWRKSERCTATRLIDPVASTSTTFQPAGVWFIT